MGEVRVFEITPHEGIGPVRLSMTREEARTAMGERPYTFRKAANRPEVDVYLDHTLYVYFDDEDKVEFIEVAQGPEFQYVYNGVDVFATKDEELVALISKDAPFDPDDRDLGYSYTFPKLDLTLWRPVLPEDRSQPKEIPYQHFESVGIGRQDYYSESVSIRGEQSGPQE